MSLELAGVSSTKQSFVRKTLPIFQIYVTTKLIMVKGLSWVLFWFLLRKTFQTESLFKFSIQTQIFSSNSVLISSKSILYWSLIYITQLRSTELGDKWKIPSLYSTLHYFFSGVLLLTIFKDLPYLKILKFHINPQNNCTLKQRARYSVSYFLATNGCSYTQHRILLRRK